MKHDGRERSRLALPAQATQARPATTSATAPEAYMLAREAGAASVRALVARGAPDVVDDEAPLLPLELEGWLLKAPVLGVTCSSSVSLPRSWNDALR